MFLQLYQSHSILLSVVVTVEEYNTTLYVISNQDWITIEVVFMQIIWDTWKLLRCVYTFDWHHQTKYFCLYMVGINPSARLAHITRIFAISYNVRYRGLCADILIFCCKVFLKSSKFLILFFSSISYFSFWLKTQFY